MLIKEKIGNLDTIDTGSKCIDWLMLEWHETGKRILHKKTVSGKEITLKFLQHTFLLTRGDVLYVDDKTIIAIDINPCDVIVIKPATMIDMANICYEIGNKHLPLFYQSDELLVVYDAPLFSLLEKAGYTVSKENRKLINPLKTTVAQHTHGNSDTLFSKIMKLTNPSEE